ncbi:MAG: flagellar assembly protein FliH [Sphingomonadales bacterium]|jgi:flagellar biosynthesis/type III secretory pathway protein FliH|nr:flagellar assembly protein FliH [Sphingomonadales bacterium]
MSRLVKATSAGGSVRRLVVAAPAGDADRRSSSVGGPRIDAVAEEIGRLEAALAEARAEAAQAVARAREEGREEARAEAEDREDGRLRALEAIATAAQGALERRLDELDRLALLLAQRALAQLVEPDAGLAALVERSIARQMRFVRGKTVAAIHVSGEDFPGEPALAELAARAGIGSVRLAADPELRSGQCRIDLRLGHVDLHVGPRWGEMAELLETMAKEEA